MIKKYLVINDDSLTIAIGSIKNYAKKHEPFNVLIQPVLEKRTSRQLRYYWVLISIIEDWLNEQGNQFTREQVSDLMKNKFYYEEKILFGQKRRVPKSISDKSETDIKEMAEYITKITVECAEWGIDIPICDDCYNFSRH